MGVRKTESRIPANFQPSDLGEAVVAGDGRCALVSFVTSPLAVGRENVYVLYVTDAALATSAQSFEWTLTTGGGAPDVQTTPHGELAYVPQETGELSLSVRILDAGDAEQASLSLTQEVLPANPLLEALIVNAGAEPGPGIGNPDVARELVNEHNPYYQSVALQTPEADDAFRRFVFSMVSDGALRRSVTRRKQHADQMASSLNSEGPDFVTLAAEGVGVCGVRLALLAMILPHGSPTKLLEWTELPEPAAQRAVADEQLRQKLAALDEDTRIDLFNLARFPKTNIEQCGRIIEALRDRYFSGAKFNDVLTGMSGTRAFWIVRHFQEGPLIKN